MLVKRISTVAPFVLVTLFFTLGGLHIFIDSREYVFVPSNAVGQSIFTAWLMIGLTIVAMLHKETATQITAAFYMILPLAAIFFVCVEFFIAKYDLKVFLVYILGYINLLTCSIIMFSKAFAYGKVKAIHVVSIVIYGILLAAVSLLLFALIFGVSSREVVRSVPSPNESYVAEFIIDGESFWGATMGVTVRPNSETHLLIGKIQKSKIIYVTKWRQYGNIYFFWETDEILCIGRTKYDMKEVLAD